MCYIMVIRFCYGCGRPGLPGRQSSGPGIDTGAFGSGIDISAPGDESVRYNDCICMGFVF